MRATFAPPPAEGPETYARERNPGRGSATGSRKVVPPAGPSHLTPSSPGEAKSRSREAPRSPRENGNPNQKTAASGFRGVAGAASNGHRECMYICVPGYVEKADRRCGILPQLDRAISNKTSVVSSHRFPVSHSSTRVETGSTFVRGRGRHRCSRNGPPKKFSPAAPRGKGVVSRVDKGYF